MKTWKMVSGILSLVFSAIVLYQSWAASILDRLADAFLDINSNSGAVGYLVAVFMIAGGIVSIVTRRGRKSGDITLAILYGLAALVGYTSFGVYKDLVFWSTWCLICAILAVISLVKGKKKVSSAYSGFNLKSEDLITADGMMEYCHYFNTFNGISESESRKLFEHAAASVAPDPQVTMAFVAYRIFSGEDRNPELCACALSNSKLIVACENALETYPVESIFSVENEIFENDGALTIKYNNGIVRLGMEKKLAQSLSASLWKSIQECQNELLNGSRLTKNKPWIRRHPWILGVAGIIVVALVLSSLPEGNRRENSPAEFDNQTQQSTGFSSLSGETTSVGAVEDNATIGERNALSQAKSYLEYSSFSANGLIEQLEYEGYTTEEAQYAVANCDADWNEQALNKALSYLEFSSFSYSGLHEQLTHEGFLPTEVQYAVDNCDADWDAEAAEAAESYMDLKAFSKDGLIEQLLYEGFTKEQAEYGAKQVGY
jgi:uncharacterized membrane protein